MTLGDFYVTGALSQNMEECMAVLARLEQLSNKHTTLETQIRQELQNPLPDTLRIAQLKKEKLHIKDVLESYEASPKA